MPTGCRRRRPMRLTRRRRWRCLPRPPSAFPRQISPAARAARWRSAATSSTWRAATRSLQPMRRFSRPLQGQTPTADTAAVVPMPTQADTAAPAAPIVPPGTPALATVTPVLAPLLASPTPPPTFGPQPTADGHAHPAAAAHAHRDPRPVILAGDRLPLRAAAVEYVRPGQPDSGAQLHGLEWKTGRHHRGIAPQPRRPKRLSVGAGQLRQ